MAHEFRIFLQEVELVPGDEVLIPERETSHLIKVVRLPPHGQVILVDPYHQREFSAFILPYSKNTTRAKARIVQELPPSRTLALPNIALLAALCKTTTNEDIVERATELGVSTLSFFVAERSITREITSSRLERMNRLIVASSQQSGRVSLPSLSLYSSLEEALRSLPALSQSRFMCSLQINAQVISHFTPLRPPYVLAIGPEGDFTSLEYLTLTRAQFSPLSLGPLRLRSEVAVTTSIAGILAHTLGSESTS
jgi:16S rRNA (uracil1498-N3)-methyltransferase